MLFGWKKPTKFDSYPGTLLPPEYHKFYKELKAEPKPVHYVPVPGRYRRIERTGEVKRNENLPLRLMNVPQMHLGIWGGEMIIKGFQKRHQMSRRVPHFWVPHLLKSVVHSEILNRFMSVVVTNRTIDLINEHFGFDNYILEVIPIILCN